MLTSAELSMYKLPAGQWVGGYIKVPPAAAVVDFVISNLQETIWDNNNGEDFHSKVEGEHHACAPRHHHHHHHHHHHQQHAVMRLLVGSSWQRRPVTAWAQH
jgi:G3E family GTPase